MWFDYSNLDQAEFMILLVLIIPGPALTKPTLGQPFVVGEMDWTRFEASCTANEPVYLQFNKLSSSINESIARRPLDKEF